ncbi:MAG: FAD-dependent oxidoreductase [Gammaproteobacteria bacterium]|nr:FAD-dependent oxidoreductase [Gammaproteobacteria bacterium]
MTAGRNNFDFIVIGGGIAGASVAYWLAPHARVVVLEGEPQPGYHSTGRSAALFIETYGPAQVRALTRASRRFFECPGRDFSEHPVLTPRGTLFVASDQQDRQLQEYWDEVRSSSTVTRRLDRVETCSMVPVLRPDRVMGSVYEPEACDIDVHALHQGYLREMRRRGGVLRCDAEVTRIEREGEHWHVHAGETTYSAPVVVNAAGAWADTVARMAGVAPIGIEPRRRSAFTFLPPGGVAVSGWPAVLGAEDDWYFKPEAGMLLGSPANADPVEPQDVQAEELDIALAIDRIEAMTTLTIPRPARVWAGLRSFVADGNLVGGFDAHTRDFFWVAAQGGYGIQTSAAMGEACAALARGLAFPQHIADFGLNAQMLSPARLAAVGPATPDAARSR